MRKLLITMILGTIAGIIDCIPMVAIGLDWLITLSAFCFWIAMGFIISYTRMSIPGYLKGLLVAELAITPCWILVLHYDPQSLPASITTMIIMSAVLGSSIGHLTRREKDQLIRS